MLFKHIKITTPQIPSLQRKAIDPLSLKIHMWSYLLSSWNLHLLHTCICIWRFSLRYKASAPHPTKNKASRISFLQIWVEHSNKQGVLTWWRALQCCFTGHSMHNGVLGVHTVAPNSIIAWLKSPGWVWSTRVWAKALRTIGLLFINAIYRRGGIQVRKRYGSLVQKISRYNTNCIAYNLA